MKKQLTIITGALLIVSLLIAGVFYLLSLRKVNFILENTSSIAVYDSKDEKKADMSSNGEIRLQDGKYYVIPSGDKIATEKIEFTINQEDETITINPSLTEEYLKKLLEKEKPAIEAAIQAKYAPLSSNYTLVQGTLYKHGEWFGGLLKPKSDPRDQRDSYRIVLHKQNNKWTIIRRPEYILTASRYTDVPIDVLRQINQIPTL